MDVQLKNITIRDLADGFIDDPDKGVVGYGGQLVIRPPYQREFIYSNRKRDDVIRTVRKSFPLNAMYWAKCSGDGYELIDGQQRTLSICRYIAGDFSVKFEGMPQYFSGLTESEKEQILNYELFIYICSGDDKEKLDWFRITNIAGDDLTSQELRNSIYTGTWLMCAREHFSREGTPVALYGSKYIKGSPVRQELLEKVLRWISARDFGAPDIERYMANHQQDTDADELSSYFESLMAWIKDTFPVYRKEMRSVDWGLLFNQFGGKRLPADKFEQRIAQLMTDDDVTKKSGVYEYVLTGNESALSIRAFTESMRRASYERQQGICPICKNYFEYDEMEADHIDPWSLGGKTVAENCQMLCREDNRRKGGK